MGYTTEFTGQFDLNKKLDPKLHEFLTKFSETRRMKRKVGPEYGEEGEFYVKGTGFHGQDNDSTIIDFNSPPSTQPSLWCDWIPTKDGLHLEWNGAEKFYDYTAWLEYIIKNFLQPKGYVLNGDVRWQGEDEGDQGDIVVVDNVVMALDLNTYAKVGSIVGKPLIESLRKSSALPMLVNVSPEVSKFVETRLKNPSPVPILAENLAQMKRRVQWQ